MTIKRWRRAGGGEMVEITPYEALRIVESLAQQIRTENNNAGRAEFHTNTGYFSIAVMPQQEQP